MFRANITEKIAEQGLPQIDLRPEEGWMLYLLTRDDKHPNRC